MLHKYFFSIITLMFFACQPDQKNAHFPHPFQNSSDFGEDVDISYYSEGILEFELIAPQIETKTQKTKHFPKGITVYAYNMHFDTLATISANYAYEHTDQDIFEVRKNVILTNNLNEQLTTEKLFWNRNTKKIYTDDFVTLTTEQQIIMGYGFLSDQYFSTYSLSNITATIYL